MQNFPAFAVCITGTACLPFCLNVEQDLFACALTSEIIDYCNEFSLEESKAEKAWICANFQWKKDHKTRA